MRQVFAQVCANFPQQPSSASLASRAEPGELFDDESDGKLQALMLKALGHEPEREVVHVDMAAKLWEAGLLAHFPCATWPPTAAVCFFCFAIGSSEMMG